MRPADTSPEAWDVLIEIYRNMPPEQKLDRAFELSEMALQLHEAGLRERYPHAGDREIFLRGVRDRIGRDLFLKAYGDVLPED